MIKRTFNLVVAEDQGGSWPEQAAACREMARHMVGRALVLAAMLALSSAVPAAFVSKKSHRHRHAHAGPAKTLGEADLITDLPGAPKDIKFKQYAGAASIMPKRPCLQACDLVPSAFVLPASTFPQGLHCFSRVCTLYQVTLTLATARRSSIGSSSPSVILERIPWCFGQTEARAARALLAFSASRVHSGLQLRASSRTTHTPGIGLPTWYSSSSLQVLSSFPASRVDSAWLVSVLHGEIQNGTKAKKKVFCVISV